MASIHLLPLHDSPLVQQSVRGKFWSSMVWNGHASIHKALHTSTFNKNEQTCLANISKSLLFFFLPSFWLFTSFPWHLFLLRTLSLDISFSWELFPFTSLSPDMISSHVFLLLFSSFDVDCIFSMSMFYSCHHSWSVPFLSIFSLTFCRPVAVRVPAKNTQALKGWEQDSKTISNYDEIWMCPKMGSGYPCSSSILIRFSWFFPFSASLWWYPHFWKTL